MRTIGITGGIASGKSVLTELLADYPVIDADQVSREAVAPGQPGLAAIAREFGPETLLPDGSLDRAKLRDMIARDPSAQKRLNAILHPLIHQAIGDKLAELAASGAELAFVSAALMIETGSYRRYDAVILVTAPFETRLQRLMRRDGMSEEAARGLMARQWTDEQKRPYADVTVVNDGDLEQLRRRAREALAQLGVAL